jgi:hypothetical protein
MGKLLFLQPKKIFFFILVIIMYQKIQHHFVDNFVMNLIGQMIHKEDFMEQE